MLKTMYQQFVTGKNAKIIDYGFTNNNKHSSKRYYTYKCDINNNYMTVYISSDTAFMPTDLQNLVTIGFIEIEAITFTQKP